MADSRVGAPPVIEIVTDGGPHGLGHLTRSVALAWALRERGIAVRVAVRSAEGRRVVPPAPGDAGDASAYVLDLPYEFGFLIRELRERGRPIVAIENYGAELADLTISVFEHRPDGAGARVSGLPYALIRREIVERRDAALAGPGAGVVVMIGGGDKRGVGEDIALRLHEAGERVTLIEGPLVPPHEGDAVPPYRRRRTPPDLAALMAGCAWAVTNGGCSMLEMMCLGKPVYVVPQTEEERVMATSIHARGALLGVGDEPERAQADTRGAAVGARAAALVDGRGLTRIGDAIASLLA